jgi:hypothetical protein
MGSSSSKPKKPQTYNIIKYGKSINFPKKLRGDKCTLIINPDGTQTDPCIKKCDFKKVSEIDRKKGIGLCTGGALPDINYQEKYQKYKSKYLDLKEKNNL